MDELPVAAIAAQRPHSWWSCIKNVATPGRTTFATAAGVTAVAMGTDLITAATWGYGHSKRLGPGIALVTTGGLVVGLAQALAPTGAFRKTAILAESIVIAAGVIMRQRGDSYFDASSGKIKKDHALFIYGVAVATLGAAGLMTELMAQVRAATPAAKSAALVCYGVVGAVGAAVILGFSASSAADVRWGRVIGTVGLAAGLGPAMVSVARRFAVPPR